MRTYTLLAASLAFPMAIASAQTTTPTERELAYIPLFGSGASGPNTTPSHSTWFIDQTRNLIVFCTQSGTTTPPSISCTAQNVPTSASTGGSTSGGTTGGTTTGGATTGSNTSNGGSSDSSAGFLRNPFSR